VGPKQRPDRAAAGSSPAAGDGPGALAGQKRCWPFPPHQPGSSCRAKLAQLRLPPGSHPARDHPHRPPHSSPHPPTLHPLLLQAGLAIPTGLPDGRSAASAPIRGRITLAPVHPACTAAQVDGAASGPRLGGPGCRGRGDGVAEAAARRSPPSRRSSAGAGRPLAPWPRNGCRPRSAKSQASTALIGGHRHQWQKPRTTTLIEHLAAAAGPDHGPVGKRLVNRLARPSRHGQPHHQLRRPLQGQLAEAVAAAAPWRPGGEFPTPLDQGAGGGPAISPRSRGSPT